MSHTRQLLALTESIYDAAVGSASWNSVEGQLRSLMQAGTATLFVGDYASGRAELLWREGFSDNDIFLYNKHFRHLDLWTTRTAAAVASSGQSQCQNAPIEVIIGGEKRVPDAEYIKSTFYNEFGRQRGMRYVIGAVVPLGQQGLMPLAFHRPSGAQPFAEAERRLVAQTASHLRRAMQLRHRLQAEAGASGLAALNALSQAVLVVDAGMRVLVANAAAETLAGLPGAALRLQRARLIMGGGDAGVRTVVTALHKPEAERLEALVHGVAQHGEAGGAMRLSGANQASHLAVMVSPMPRQLTSTGGAGHAQGQALLLLRDLTPPNVAPPRLKLLRDLFGLTQAEAEVAAALTGGVGTPSVAAQRGLKDSTVRSQARAILSKTGASNLRELERLLAGLQGM